MLGKILPGVASAGSVETVSRPDLVKISKNDFGTSKDSSSPSIILPTYKRENRPEFCNRPEVRKFNTLASAPAIEIADAPSLPVPADVIKRLADTLRVDHGQNQIKQIIVRLREFDSVLDACTDEKLRAGQAQSAGRLLLSSEWKAQFSLSDEQVKLLKDARESMHMRVILTQEKNIVVHYLGSAAPIFTSDNRQNLATARGKTGRHYRSLAPLIDVWADIAGKGNQVVFTGHSKGGGLAMASTQMLKKKMEGRPAWKSFSISNDAQLLNDSQAANAGFNGSPETDTVIFTLQFKGAGDGLMEKQKRHGFHHPNALQIMLNLRAEDGNRTFLDENGVIKIKTGLPKKDLIFGYHGEQNDPILYRRALGRLIERLEFSLQTSPDKTETL